MSVSIQPRGVGGLKLISVGSGDSTLRARRRPDACWLYVECTITCVLWQLGEVAVALT